MWEGTSEGSCSFTEHLGGVGGDPSCKDSGGRQGG